MLHVELMCENHPNLRWHCKSIAVNENGRYNHSRNIFFNGANSMGVYECNCPASKLIWTEKGRETWLKDQ